MKRKTAIIFFVLFFLLIIFAAFFTYRYFKNIEDNKKYDINKTITIANWNLQIFGEKKANDTELMNFYASTIKNFDIIFVQEIRDKSGDSFKELCNLLGVYDYSCNVSSRAGRSTSKEQYGIIYSRKVNLTNLIDYNPDSLDRWERPPIRAYFSIADSISGRVINYSFNVINIHTKPDDTPNELKNLETLAKNSEKNTNIILIGDMNADCSYYSKRSDFLNWHWIIQDNLDTTSGPSDCAYDRIIMNDDAYNEMVDYGIYKNGIDKSISDHYLVWVRIKNYESSQESS